MNRLIGTVPAMLTLGLTLAQHLWYKPLLLHQNVQDKPILTHSMVVNRIVLFTSSTLGPIGTAPNIVPPPRQG